MAIRCRQCGYDLTEAATARCPECGTFYDPGHPRTFLTKPASGLRALLLSLAALVLSGFPIAVAWLIDLQQSANAGSPKFDAGSNILLLVVLALPGPVMIVGGVALAFHVAVRSARALLGKPPWRVHTTLFVVALAISAGEVAAFFYQTVISAVLRFAS